MLVFYLHVCMCSMCVSIAWGGQKMVSDSLGLQLQRWLVDTCHSEISFVTAIFQILLIMSFHDRICNNSQTLCL